MDPDAIDKKADLLEWVAVFTHPDSGISREEVHRIVHLHVGYYRGLANDIREGKLAP